MKKKLFSILLAITFVLTLLVPITGIHLHKLAATLFLVLCLIHTVSNRKKMGVRKYGLLFVIVAAFVTGILGMIYEELPLLLALHKVMSLLAVGIVSVHMFVYRRRVGKSITL